MRGVLIHALRDGIPRLESREPHFYATWE